MRQLVFLLVLGFYALGHFSSAFAAKCSPDDLLQELKNSLDPIPDVPDLKFYEAYRVLGLKPQAKLEDFQPQTGIFLKRDASGNVLRNADGSPVEAKIRVLTDNPGAKLTVIGDFNQWGKGLTPTEMSRYELKPVPGSRYHEGVIPGLKHAQRYRFVLNGKEVFDPSSAAYTTPEFSEKVYGKREEFLNSVFWDFGRPDGYKMKNSAPDLRRQHLSIGEIELYGAVKEFPRPDGTGHGPARAVDTYAYIADPNTGFLTKFKDSFGWNAVHLLPVNQSISGEAWQHRYQVYGNFAPDSKFGTPDEFAKAVDAMNGQGIGVVLDYLGSHFPYKGELSETGLANWKKENGQPLFSANQTEWGTVRYDYQNPFVKRFLIDGAIEMFKKFHIAGLRIDNIGGIMQQPGGRDFLVELASEIRKYKPDAIIMHEDFVGSDRAESLAQGGLGANGRNGSDYFGWVRDVAQLRGDQLDMQRLRDIVRNIWNWKEMGQIPYTTNHDESAQGTSGATGAYFVSLVDGGGNFHSYGKARVFNGMAMTMLAMSEDTPQLRVLQRGNLNFNPAIDWFRLNDPEIRNHASFMARLTNYINGNRAFAFENLHENIENHTDYGNKIMSLLRIDRATGKKTYVLINFSEKEFHDYAFGVDADGPLALKLNSDSREFGGSNQLQDRAQNQELNVSGSGMHGKSHSVSLPYVAPYSITILEK